MIVWESIIYNLDLYWCSRRLIEGLFMCTTGSNLAIFSDIFYLLCAFATYPKWEDLFRKSEGQQLPLLISMMKVPLSNTHT